MSSPAPLITKPMLIRSLKVSLVVGTILNLINQPEALMGQAPMVYWKLGLTYLVPFCVATYGAVTAMAAHNRDVHGD